MPKKKLKSVYISTFAPWWEKDKHSSTNGMIEPLLYYFLPRVSRVRLLEQPYPGSTRVIPFYYQYQNEKLEQTQKTLISTFFIYPILLLFNRSGTHLIFKLRDLLSTIEAGLRLNSKYDTFIGLEFVNTLAGLFLRKIGKVGVVCYYVSDYSPNRFGSKIINSVYLWLDRYCAKKADFIWDVSLAMQPARIKSGLDPKKSAPVIHIPNALFKEQLETIDSTKRTKNTVVFVGTLGLENGPDLAVEAFSIVVKKIPSAKLHIIGGGGIGFEFEYLKKLAKKLHLSNNVEFYGFISDVKKISQIINKFQVAVAPYKKIEGSVRLYGDATKIRQYTAAGLPVITTSVPPLGKQIQKNGAGLIVDENKEKLAAAIIDLLTNNAKRVEMTEHAINFAKNNTWENTYNNALRKMGFTI